MLVLVDNGAEAALNAKRTTRTFQSYVWVFTEGLCQNGNDFFSSKDTVTAMPGTLADNTLAF